MMGEDSQGKSRMHEWSHNPSHHGEFNLLQVEYGSSGQGKGVQPAA